LDWFAFELVWPEVALWSWDEVAPAAFWSADEEVEDDGAAVVSVLVEVVDWFVVVLVLDWSAAVPVVPEVEDDGVWLELLLMSEPVVLVAAGAELVEPALEPTAPALLVSVPVVPVVEVAVPVVPPVVGVVADWLLVVLLWLASGIWPTWPLFVEVGEVLDGGCWLLVSIAPVELVPLVLDAGCDVVLEVDDCAFGSVVLVAVDWVLVVPAAVFCASGDWLPVCVALPAALVLWVLVCWAALGSTGWALAGTCDCALGSVLCELVELVACAFGSVVDVLELVCA
jgi:hypothetical protein